MSEQEPVGPDPTQSDGASRPWLQHYPAGVPHRIDEESRDSLLDIFDETVSRYPERPAIESFGVRISYSQWARAAGAVASWLQSRGVGRGERVAIMMPNVAAYPTILVGTLLAGAAVVNVNPLYTGPELAHQLADSGARTIFVLENFAATVEQAVHGLAVADIVVVKPGDGIGLKGRLVDLVSRYVKRAVPPFRLPDATRYADVVRYGRAHPPGRTDVRSDDVAFLQYTGGTTGVAKAAVLTHGNVVANVNQSAAWVAPALGRDQHVMVTALPLYHIFALTSCCLVMVRLGGCQVLIANPRDIAGFVKVLRTRPFTCISGVNTLFAALARAPGIGAVDFRPLVFCIAGGMATQAATAAAWRRLTGRPIIEGYGLSETSPVLACNRVDIEEFTGTIGYPMPSTEISIRSPETGAPLPLGEAGELCARGPQVMRGYWNRPDETARAMTADGFFRTGDIAVLDGTGRLRIVDRIKDMIIVSGFNVYPNEVEDALASCPGVAEVAVVGQPDGRTGETVVAHIVATDPALDAVVLTAWCRERLAAYKLPRRFVFADSLPKNNVGKVLRRVLRTPERPV